MSIPMETVERSPALLDALHELAKVVEAKTGFNMQKGDLPGFSEMCVHHTLSTTGVSQG